MCCGVGQVQLVSEVSKAGRADLRLKVLPDFLPLAVYGVDGGGRNNRGSGGPGDVKLCTVLPLAHCPIITPLCPLAIGDEFRRHPSAGGCFIGNFRLLTALDPHADAAFPAPLRTQGGSGQTIAVETPLGGESAGPLDHGTHAEWPVCSHVVTCRSAAADAQSPGLRCNTTTRRNCPGFHRKGVGSISRTSEE